MHNERLLVLAQVYEELVGALELRGAPSISTESLRKMAEEARKAYAAEQD